jgi:hypothetical protein
MYCCALSLIVIECCFISLYLPKQTLIYRSPPSSVVEVAKLGRHHEVNLRPHIKELR